VAGGAARQEPSAAVQGPDRCVCAVQAAGGFVLGKGAWVGGWVGVDCIQGCGVVLRAVTQHAPSPRPSTFQLTSSATYPTSPTPLPSTSNPTLPSPLTTPPKPQQNNKTKPTTAYALEAIPYDVSELVVVGNLNDARAASEAAEAAGKDGGPLAAVARGVPQPVWDVSRCGFGGLGLSGLGSCMMGLGWVGGYCIHVALLALAALMMHS